MDRPTLAGAHDANGGNRRDVWSEWTQKITLSGTALPLPAGGDPDLFNVPFCDGRTPLIAAIRAQQHDLVVEIIQRGADPNLHDLEGKTPLIHAVETAQVDTVHLLLRSGCDPNKSDATGRTPLMYATYKGTEDMVRVIAKAGGSTNSVDVDGRTAADYAGYSWGQERANHLLKELNCSEGNNSRPLKKPKTRFHYAVPEYINYIHAKDTVSLKKFYGRYFPFLFLFFCFNAFFNIFGLAWNFVWIIDGAFALFAFYYAIQTRYHYELTFKGEVKADLADFSFNQDLASYKQSRTLSNAFRSATRRIALDCPWKNVSSYQNKIDWMTGLWLTLIFLMLVSTCMFFSYLPFLFGQSIYDITLGSILQMHFSFVFSLVYYLLLLPTVFLTKRRLVRVQKRRSEAAIQFLNQVTLQGTSESIPDTPFALFLRSFQQDEHLYIAGVDFEAVLAYSIGQLCEVVAMGGRSEQLGAAKLQIADQDWQQTIKGLADQAVLIFMIPYNTPSVMWEMQYLMRANIMDKVIFIMPPFSFLAKRRDDHRMEEAWSNLINRSELRGAEIPSYFRKGCICTLENDGTIKDWDALGMEMMPWVLASAISTGSIPRSDSLSDIRSIPVGTAESLTLIEGVLADSLSIMDLSGPATGGGAGDSGWSAGDSGGGGSGLGGDGSGLGGDGSGSSGGGSGGGGGSGV